MPKGVYKRNINWSPINKNKTFEESYGKNKAIQMKGNLRNKNKNKIVSIETRDKMRKSYNLNIKRNHGNVASAETRKKMSFANKKIIHTKEWNQKISDANKGKIRTEECKAKTSNRQKLRYKMQDNPVKGQKRPSISGDKNPSKRPENRQLLREIRLRQILKDGGNMQIGKHEKQLLDQLEQLFKYKIDRNFYTIGYKPDGYIKELNLVIEIDEKHHFGADGNLKQKDVIRQNNIQKELGCRFLRIKDRGEPK